MKLRPYRTDDLPRLYEIHRAALGPYVEATWGWDEDSQASQFQQRADRGTWHVIEEDGTVLGFMSFDEADDRSVLNTIELAPEHQRCGVGSKLIRDLLSRARKRGVPVELRVLKCNPARALYERLGFSAIGETETHVLMRTRQAV